MTKSPKTASHTAVALVGGGLLLVFLAWNGAASLDFTQGQIPYLISGGITGIILASAGLTLVRVQEARRDARLVAAKLDEVIDALRRQAVAGPVPASPPTGDGGPPRAAGGAADGYVVAGRSSYHLPSCRVVEGRIQELRLLAPQQADAQGLQPCRVCRPSFESPLGANRDRVSK